MTAGESRWAQLTARARLPLQLSDPANRRICPALGPNGKIDVQIRLDRTPAWSDAALKPGGVQLGSIGAQIAFDESSLRCTPRSMVAGNILGERSMPLFTLICLVGPTLGPGIMRSTSGAFIPTVRGGHSPAKLKVKCWTGGAVPIVAWTDYWQETGSAIQFGPSNVFYGEYVWSPPFSTCGSEVMPGCEMVMIIVCKVE